MDLIALLGALVVLVPALGLVGWTWLTAMQVEDDLRSFAGVEGMHFDI